MSDHVDKLIDEVIEREGRTFTNNAADRGGPTKFGITQRTLSGWRDHAVTAKDVENLMEPEARLIYRRLYVQLPGYNRIADPMLQGVVVDAAVNHGPPTATRFIQRALGTDLEGNALKEDGVFGDKTAAALNALDPRRMAVLCLAERIKFYGRLISKNLTDADKDGVPDNTEFAAGWLNRVAGLMADAA